MAYYMPGTHKGLYMYFHLVLAAIWWHSWHYSEFIDEETEVYRDRRLIQDQIANKGQSSDLKSGPSTSEVYPLI